MDSSRQFDTKRATSQTKQSTCTTESKQKKKTEQQKNEKNPALLRRLNPNPHPYFHCAPYGDRHIYLYLLIVLKDGFTPSPISLKALTNVGGSYLFLFVPFPSPHPPAIIMSMQSCLSFTILFLFFSTRKPFTAVSYCYRLLYVQLASCQHRRTPPCWYLPYNHPGRTAQAGTR